MVLVTCKDVEIWYEKAHQVVERIDYISVVQKGRDAEEHDIRVLRDNNIDRIRKVGRILGENGPRTSVGDSREMGRL
jgi:ribosomal protein L1